MTDNVSTARARFLRGSPQKFRLVVDQIRGRGVSEALGILELSRKRASNSVEKLLRSAVANAENLNPEVDVDEEGVLRYVFRELVARPRVRVAAEDADEDPFEELEAREAEREARARRES